MKPVSSAHPGAKRMMNRLESVARDDRVAVIDDRGEVRGSELYVRALRAAAVLGAPLDGRRVALLATQDADWVVAFLGILLGGGVAVPLTPAYPAEELAWFVADAGAEIAVCDDAHTLPSARLVRTRDLAAAPPATPTHAPGDALLLYTSGTTARPKGARITHANLDVQTTLLRDNWGISPDDRMLHALPLHHLHGLISALLSTLFAGGAVRMLPRFDAARVAAELHRATVWMAVPTMYHRLRDHGGADLAAAAPRLRLATSGSAALPASLAGWWRDLSGAIPLERYGMTEIGIALSNPLAPEGRRIGHVGFPLPTVETRIDGGELFVRGPAVFAGYHNRPEAQAFDDEGWFHTGDVAEVAPDGHHRLLGRTSVDILKSGGEKISALHVEEALRAHPAVSDVAVVGLPDERWGERLVAAIVARAPVTIEDLREHARAHLAAHEVPKELVLVDELPRNPLGKVVKPELRERLSRRAPSALP